MNTRWFSLRRRLLTLLLGGVTALWLAGSVWIYTEVHHEMHELLEHRLDHHGKHDEHEHDKLIAGVAWRLVTPALLGLPLLGLWIWLATWRGLQPLDAVAREIAARRPDKLEPVSPASAPKEIRPLVEAINGLFVRVEHALESERRFTADAAHELRTPLAALATQAQVALRARDDAERGHAIEQLIASSRRAARLVDQLLTLARLDPDEAVPATPLRLDTLAEEICAAHGADAMAKNIALELEAAPTTMRGHADMLRILLRNLVDNAIRYTPAGGRVVVAVAPGLLSVTDSGPGIPVVERERVFDRFHRLAGQQTEGSGLGLSIVARIAERHGARIHLGDGAAGVGLRVEVAFSAVS
jgi:signal transduction histidine kinase